MDDLRHPMQSVGIVGGVARFKGNDIVRFLLENCRVNLEWITDEIDSGRFTDKDLAQLLQLLGTSVKDYGEFLSTRTGGKHEIINKSR